LRGDNLIFDYLFGLYFFCFFVFVFSHSNADQDIAVVGAIQVSLRVKTSRNDTDFVVRVSDVYPGSSGVSMLLGDNIVRMRWRENKFYTTPTTPGEEYVITMQMWSTAYVFNAGHKLRIAVTSSNYPRYSANPNNGNLIWQGGPVYNATNTLILGADSYVVLPTVGLGQLPKISVFK
jgi:putative CocE/NonD family hydrolase